MKLDPNIVLQLLVVEDDPTDRSWLEVMLTNASVCGYTTTHVGSAKEAVEAIQDQQFHCVLLDLLLPDAQGLEALEKILVVSPDMPVVVFTQVDDLAVGLAAIDAGAHEYLVKGQASGSQMLKAALFATARAVATGPEGEGAPTVPAAMVAGTIATSDGDAEVCLDGDRHIVAASEQFYELTSTKPGSVIGAAFDRFLNESDARSFAAGFERFHAGQLAPFVRRIDLASAGGPAFLMATVVQGGAWNGVLVLLTRVRRSD
jgi:CheY-like chemotaxis protein